MYESFFGFQRRPFAMTPDPGCFHAPEGVQAALDELVVCAEQGLGIGILTGPAGVGKTLLCERLTRELSARLVVVLFRHGHFPSRRGLLQSLLCELGQPYNKLSEHELRLELLPIVREIRDRGQSLVIICDEAHALSEEHLEELRMLSDMAENGVPLVRLILCGQLGLEEKLAHPLLGPLGQRVAAQVCLLPLLREGTLDYIDFRGTWAGRSASGLFTSGALDLVHRICDGLPRCINQLCDHALLLAYVAEAKQVTETHVRESLEDLRRLPQQWHEPAQSEWFITQHSSSEEESSWTDQSFPDRNSLDPDTVSGTVLEFMSASGETSAVALETGSYGVTDSFEIAVFHSDEWEVVGAVEPPDNLSPHVAAGGDGTSAHLFDIEADAEPVVCRVPSPSDISGDFPIGDHSPESVGMNSEPTEEIVVDRYARLEAGQSSPSVSISPEQPDTGDAWALESPDSQDLAETARRWSEAIELSPVYSDASAMGGEISPSTTPEEQLKSAVMELVHAARYAVEPQGQPDQGHDSRVGDEVPTSAHPDHRIVANHPVASEPEACAFEVGHEMVNRPLGSPASGVHATGSTSIEPEPIGTSQPESTAPAARPYRHLFSLLRRKQSGLQ